MDARFVRDSARYASRSSVHTHSLLLGCAGVLLGCAEGAPRVRQLVIWCSFDAPKGALSAFATVFECSLREVLVGSDVPNVT